MSGVMARSVSAEGIVESGYLGITLKAESGYTAYVMLSNENAEADQYTFVGECQIRKGENTYYFDISEFADEVDSSDSVTVAICVIPKGNVAATIEICELALYGNAPVDVETIIIIVVVVIVVLALVGLIIFLAIKRKKKNADKPENKKPAGKSDNKKSAGTREG
jgi:hypothetical protein